MNIMQTLNDYVAKVLDTNKDGKITVKDFIDLFPNHSVAIAFIFVDIVVAAAEYRVWDIGYKMTGDPFKAAGFVLVSAVPFYLGQLFWLYPVANSIQKFIAVAMVAASLYTSWTFGTADLSQSYDVAAIIGLVTDLTAGYIIIVLAYILSDDGIKAHRIKRQAQGAAAREREYQRITREVLRELAETQRLQQDTEREFGNAELVQAQLDRLRGTKPTKPQPPQYQMKSFAANVEKVEAPKAEGQNGQKPPQ